VASAAPASQSDGFFSNLARKVGLGGTADVAASTPPIPVQSAKPKSSEARPPRPEASIPKPRPSDTKHAAARPPLKPSISDNAAPAPATNNAQVAGSQPIVQANSFESRFSAAVK
jgi:hypothetical protein